MGAMAASGGRMAPRPVESILRGEILPMLAPCIRDLVAAMAWGKAEELEEIRLREGRPLMVGGGGWDTMLDLEGRGTQNPGRAYLVTRDDVSRTLQLMSRGSLYAVEDELRGGYLTLQGGHRVGLAGRAVLENGAVRTLKHISGLNVRLARERPGAADAVIGRLVSKGGRVGSALIVSPPQCGKTTLLRDIVRQLSYGLPALGLAGQKVGVVDERSEIAACWDGVPQNDVGPRTDVLDACPKAEGMMMMLRSMSPAVVATDEIGRPEDALAVQEALAAGVAVLATAHGRTPDEVAGRPALRELMAAGAFERYIILSRRRGPGTVEAILGNGETDVTGERGGI